MGKELFDSCPAAREVFETVDEAIGAKLSDIIFNGPMEELTLTANVQPAIFATSMAMLRAAQHKGLAPDPAFVAGHSLGEYTALCAADALSVFDTAKLLRLRGESMQRAVPVGQGAMAVIMGLDIDALREICAHAEHGEICDIANDNAPGQIVISGNKAAIERAMELATAAGAKRAMLLPLSVPPHSRLMAPVAVEMHDALYKIDMKAPRVPLVSNRTCTPMTDVDEIKDALVYQITQGVRWRETVLAMPALGITEVMEIGPGNILSGLVPRIVPELAAKKLEV